MNPTLLASVEDLVIDSATLDIPLRVQVPNNHILTQNLYYNYYYPNPKYLIIGYMDPLGSTPIPGDCCQGIECQVHNHGPTLPGA